MQASSETYGTLKLEGILEAPQNLCVVCDPTSSRGHNLGVIPCLRRGLFHGLRHPESLARRSRRGRGRWVGQHSRSRPAARVLTFPSTWLLLPTFALAMSISSLTSRNWSGMDGNIASHLSRSSSTTSMTRTGNRESPRHHGAWHRFACGQIPAHRCALRIFADAGYKVAPFKSQNMVSQSAATVEGLEIGRAQALQAEAARIAPSVHMNPILLKPAGHMTSQVIVRGKIWGRLSASDYHQHRVEELFPIVCESYENTRLPV